MYVLWHSCSCCSIFSFLCSVYFLFVCLMAFNATFNNIPVISWRLVLLVEDSRRPGEYHWPVASHWQTVSHNFVHLAPITDYLGSCKSNYHTITATTVLCVVLVEQLLSFCSFYFGHLFELGWAFMHYQVSKLW